MAVWQSRESFAGLHVSVIGAARSGIAAARVLARLGAHVTLSDSAAREAIEPRRIAEIEETGARFVAAARVEEALPAGTRLVVTSPGVPRRAEVLERAGQLGIPVWSEVELAYRLAGAPLAAVTGTNGKTTTTLLIAAMLECAGLSAIVAGNISADEIKRTLVDAAFSVSPLAPQAERAPGSPILVAEISSFQLEWVEQFAPTVGVLTNITPDHLNRYSGFEEYAAAKARIFAAQGPDDLAVLNADDPAARSIGEAGLPARLLWFTTRHERPESGPGCWVEEGVLCARLALSGPAQLRIPRERLSEALPGRHSMQNVLAAAAAALALGAHPNAIEEAVRRFPGVPHRMEFVAARHGVRYVNNSMCTNVAAAISSLSSLDRPGVIIMGGADKGLDFAPLAPALRSHARELLLIGAAADRMERTLRDAGFDAIRRAPTLEDAVLAAGRSALEGETVMLCPACASFDMFHDFEERGAAFRRAVKNL